MRATPLRPGTLHRSAEFTSPLTVPGGEVAGTEIVRELPPELALTVWQVLRTVLLWAAEIPAQRGDLFERRAMEQWERELLEGTFDPDVRCPLAVIVGEMAALEEASAEQMAHACLCVTEWGLAHNATRTALAFTEAAALCRPDHPRYAWMAGRLLRSHGYLREAEQWIKRSVRIASSRGDWEAQTLGLNSLGNVFYEQGNYPVSLRTLREGLRVARKHRLTQREGEILHDLFVVATWSGDLDRAEQYAREAFDIYRTGHHRLAALAHDVAVLWMMRGHFSRALFVLQELPPYIHAPEERTRVYAVLARAAGACGQERLFTRAWEEAWSFFEDATAEKRAAPDLVELGLGASSLRKWEMAESALERAIRIASVTGEADVRMRAESALQAVTGRRVAENERSQADARQVPAADQLASGFLVSLQQNGFNAVAA
jgi:tetratricopeptide (TPR) repeat protein